MELAGMIVAILFGRAFSAGWNEFDSFLFTLLSLGATALGLAYLRF